MVSLVLSLPYRGMPSKLSYPVTLKNCKTKRNNTKVSSKNDESEDVGFYQVNLRLADNQKYADLYVIAKRIYNEL